MDMPWKSLAPADNRREYFALLSYLPLKSYWTIPMFFSFTFRILAQLAKTSGVIGYGMRAKLLSRQFWTLSVWENQNALMDFVKRVPHGEAMKAMISHMGPTKFTQWKIPGAAVPPKWDEAIGRSQET
jgi:hypothetical protein